MTWTISVLLAMTTFACREQDDEAVETARKFVRALQSRNPHMLIPLLEERAVGQLARAAERASNQVGGRSNIEPFEVLQVVEVDPTLQLAQATLVAADDTTARVLIVLGDGSEHELDLVKEEGVWHVRIPIPAETREEQRP